MSIPLSIHLLNVGQGDGYIVSLPDKSAILIDGGRSSDALQEYIHHNSYKIKVAIITHNDADHVNAFLEIMQNRAFDWLADLEWVGYVEDRGRIHDNALDKLIIALEGYASRKPEFIWEDLADADKPLILAEHIAEYFKVEILHPTKAVNQHAKRMKKGGPNRTSVITRIVYGSQKVLFGADLDKPGWKFLLKNFPKYISANVFTISHHGAPQNGGWKLWDKLVENEIKPDIAFVSVGQHAKFKHPYRETLIPFKKIGCHIACSNLTQNCHSVPDPSMSAIGYTSDEIKQTPCLGSMLLTLTETEVIFTDKTAHSDKVSNLVGSPMCINKPVV